MTVLVVLLTAVLAGYYVTVGLRTQAAGCESVRDDGTVQESQATWRWWPPGYTCVPSGEDSGVPA